MTTAKMAGAMSTASKTMGSVNAQMKPAQMQSTLRNFEMESAKMDMTEDMINETLDSILDESGDEEEQDAVVNQVLDEIGIEVAGRMAEAPSAHAGKLPTGQRAGASKGTSDADIEEMLSKLRT